jgi:hypothetical protein
MSIFKQDPELLDAPMVHDKEYRSPSWQPPQLLDDTSNLEAGRNEPNIDTIDILEVNTDYFRDVLVVVEIWAPLLVGF